MSSSLESLAVKSSRVSSHSAKFESSRESPKKVTRVRLESLPVTRVNNSATMVSIVTIQVKNCEPILQDKSLLKSLKQESFDVFIVDFADNCGRIVADFIDVPTIVYSMTGLGLDASTMPTPLGPAIMPLSAVVVDDIPLWDRLSVKLQCVIATLVWEPVWFGPFQSLRERHDMNASLAVSRSFDRALTLLSADFVLDVPRPLMPNVVPIGDLISQPGRSLPAGPLAEFIAGAGEHGFVVVCFGTLFTRADDARAELLAGALARLPQRVVWRQTGRRPRAVGSNTLLVDWLPQNDLLAAGAVAFVSHCGMSSTFEAVRHGVPVVATPLAADGFPNAAKLQRLGMAVVVDWSDEASLETRLHDALVDVTTQPRFRERAKRAAALVADRMTSPAETFLYYVDYVSRHGGVAHLTSSSPSTLSIYDSEALAVLGLALVSAVTLTLGLLYVTTVTMCRCVRFASVTGTQKNKQH